MLHNLLQQETAHAANTSAAQTAGSGTAPGMISPWETVVLLNQLGGATPKSPL